MATIGHKSVSEPYRLLGGDEPPAVSLENQNGRAPVLVNCDHASNLIPRGLDSLGLDSQQLERHIAYDIGALDLSRAISNRLDAPLIHSGYSRLVIDLNRHLDNPGSMPIISEGTEIPGNHAISAGQRQARIDELFWPYHNRFAQVLDAFAENAVVPVVLAIHTFTPVYHGVSRPWEIGLMWDTDARMVRPFMDNLNHTSGLVVGNNQPYTALDPLGYAFDVHARGRGLPHLFIEVRQDLVNDAAGVEHWAGIIVDALRPLLDNESLFAILEQS